MKILFLLLFCFLLPLQGNCGKKILMIGFIPKGGEEQLLCRKIPGAVMNSWFEAWWKISLELKKHDIELCFEQNTEFCKNFQRDSVEWERVASEYELFIYHDIPDYLNPICAEKLGHKSIAIVAEPPTVIKSQYNINLLNYFATVLSWNDDLINKEKIKKFSYPVLTTYKGGISFSERKKSCMMCGNKSSNFTHELYSERKKIIRFFKNDPHFFSLYGNGWEDLNIKAYKGIAPFKYPILREHLFNFCLENTTNTQGYITEKIFDAFEAGCIPIYLGPANIDTYIPKNCYIDYKRFPSLRELKKFMLQFNENDYLIFQEHIKNFLTSKQAEQFSEDEYTRIMLNEIKNNLHLTDM